MLHFVRERSFMGQFDGRAETGIAMKRAVERFQLCDALERETLIDRRQWKENRYVRILTMFRPERHRHFAHQIVRLNEKMR